jgi:hypothetical protein
MLFVFFYGTKMEPIYCANLTLFHQPTRDLLGELQHLIMQRLLFLCIWILKRRRLQSSLIPGSPILISSQFHAVPLPWQRLIRVSYQPLFPFFLPAPLFCFRTSLCCKNVQQISQFLVLRGLYMRIPDGFLVLLRVFLEPLIKLIRT